jgi:hypothetical protein
MNGTSVEFSVFGRIGAPAGGRLVDAAGASATSNGG